MARHSAAAQAAFATAIPTPEPAPPNALTPEEAESWREITASLPPDWFDGANAALLVELCRHIVLARQISEQLARMRRAKLTAATAHGQRTRQAFRQLLRMAQAETQGIVSLSTKLRLSRSSHRHNDRDGDERRRVIQPSGPLPWEQ